MWWLLFILVLIYFNFILFQFHFLSSESRPDHAFSLWANHDNTHFTGTPAAVSKQPEPWPGRPRAFTEPLSHCRVSGGPPASVEHCHSLSCSAHIPTQRKALRWFLRLLHRSDWQGVSVVALTWCTQHLTGKKSSYWRDDHLNCLRVGWVHGDRNTGGSVDHEVAVVIRQHRDGDDLHTWRRETRDCDR